MGECSSGTCPLTSTWWRGALYGAAIGLLVAFGFTRPLISMSFTQVRLIFASAAFVALASGAAAAEPWTLDGAVAYALAHSPDAQVARARVEGAQALALRTQGAGGQDRPMRNHPGADLRTTGHARAGVDRGEDPPTLANPVIGDDVKATLTKFLAMSDKIGETSKRLNQQEQQARN